CRELRRLVGPAGGVGPAASAVGTIVFSPNSQALASVTEDGAVCLWDGAGGRLGRHVPEAGGRGAGRGGPHAVTFSPDGKALAHGGAGQSVVLREAASGKELARLAGHRGEIWSLAFSPDGKRLASGSSDSTGLVWDVARLVSENPS